MATKAKARKPTRHAPTKAKPTLTKLQRQGLEALDDEPVVSSKSPSDRKKKKPLTIRAVRKIPKKHRALRAAAFLGVGALEVTGVTLKLGGKGLGHVGKVAGRKAKRDLQFRKWTSAPQVGADKKWYQPTMDLKCCGKHFHSIQGVNQHLVAQHRGEKRQIVSSRPQVQRGHTRKTEGKIIVRPQMAGGGRHRARHNIPDATRATALIAAYRTELAAVRERVEKIMSDQTTVQAALRNAGAAIGDVQVNGKTKLSELRELMIGFEMGLNLVADGIDDLGLTLRSERGGNIDPALVRPFIREAVEGIQESAKVFTRFIVAFEEIYGLRILAERGELSKPNINLAS